MLSRLRLIASLCLPLAALPALAAAVGKKDSLSERIPAKQREYQIVLQGKKFETRAAGVTALFVYLQVLEGQLKKEGKKKKFKYDKKSGNDEKRVAVFLDTRGGDLNRARCALRYRKTLEKWDPRAAKWLRVEAKDSRANLTIKHNADSEAAALRIDLTPAAAYLRGGKSKGKWQSKIEWDLYQPGNEKYGYSISLYGKHFRSCVSGVGDLRDVKAVGKLLPGVAKRLKLPEVTKLTRRYEFRWTRDNIKLEMGGKDCAGTLMLVYRTKAAMDAGTSAPEKVEFSWRLKQDEKNWKKKSFHYSEIVRKELWKGPWAKPAK